MNKNSLNRPHAVLKDFLGALPVRNNFLIHKNAKKFKGQRILEIGAHVGFMSKSILDYSLKLTVIENDKKCIQLLRKNVGAKVKIIEDDVHHALLKMKPGRFDVIVCAGILYHSASPLFLLESICRLKPHLILLDTLVAKEPNPIAIIQTAAVNTFNFRYNHGPDCGFNILLSDSVIDHSFANMYYTKIKSARKTHLEIQPSLDSAYFQQWKKSYTEWFKLKK